MKTNNKTEVITLRITPTNKQLIKQKAEAAGMSLSEFAVTQAMRISTRSPTAQAILSELHQLSVETKPFLEAPIKSPAAHQEYLDRVKVALHRINVHMDASPGKGRRSCK